MSGRNKSLIHKSQEPNNCNFFSFESIWYNYTIILKSKIWNKFFYFQMKDKYT